MSRRKQGSAADAAKRESKVVPVEVLDVQNRRSSVIPGGVIADIGNRENEFMPSVTISLENEKLIQLFIKEFFEEKERRDKKKSKFLKTCTVLLLLIALMAFIWQVWSTYKVPFL